MRKALLAIMAAAVVVVPMVSAHADPEPKVWVCKYVGTPGVDERLKSGKQPIEVSANATDGAQVGSYFNDAQGRSYVLAVDEGQTPPTAADCPAGDQPPPPPHDVRYKVVIRMTGEGKVVATTKAPADADEALNLQGLVCGKRITAGFGVTIGDDYSQSFGPYTSKKGPVARISQAGVVLLKLRSGAYC